MSASAHRTMSWLHALLGWMERHHHSHHHHRRASEAPVLLVAQISINLKEKTVRVDLTWTTPTTRIDGSPLALADIKATNVLRNGVIIASPVTVPTMAFSDTQPLTGADVYTVDVVTTDGLVSAESNAVTINVPAANPAVAVADLAGTLVL